MKNSKSTPPLSSSGLPSKKPPAGPESHLPYLRAYLLEYDDSVSIRGHEIESCNIIDGTKQLEAGGGEIQTWL